MIDFTKAEIGQEVNDPRFGNGVISHVKNTIDYPVVVTFKGNPIHEFQVAFTREGASLSSSFPTLRVGCFPPLDQGELPKKPKPLEWKGELVWAYVSDNGNYKDAIFLGKRLVIAVDFDKFYAIINGDNISNYSTIASWKYAWEMEE